MTEPTTKVTPTWVGAWAIRAAMVFLGLLVTTVALDLFGFGKVTNPFSDWDAWWQFLIVGLGISLMLGLEFLIEYLGWSVTEPEKTPRDLPMN